MAERDIAQHLLSARRVTALLGGGRPRRHGDGGCLYLQVNGPERGAWVFMYKRGGKQRPIGLGSARDVPLKDARDLAEACRRAVRLGRDPKTVLAEAVGELTFDAAARELIESMAGGWRNAKHRAQWRMILVGEMVAEDGSAKKTRHDYCAAIRSKPVSKLTTEDALRVLKPLWQTRPETANRLRGRCERVWDFAKVRGHCLGENPFRWRGHLDKLLPRWPRLTRGHHKAMPFAYVPAFVDRLRAMKGVVGPEIREHKGTGGGGPPHGATVAHPPTPQASRPTPPPPPPRAAAHPPPPPRAATPPRAAAAPPPPRAAAPPPRPAAPAAKPKCQPGQHC